MAIVKAGLLSRDHPALVLLQPRRVAARAAAGRIAEENGWTLGDEVGYQIRFERRIGPTTRLRVVTEGILNRQLSPTPSSKASAPWCSTSSTSGASTPTWPLACSGRSAETVRDDLILVVMSATMDAEPVARFLGGCPVLQVEGRAFPVAIEHRAAARARRPRRSPPRSRRS